MRQILILLLFVFASCASTNQQIDGDKEAKEKIRNRYKHARRALDR